jgi:hypothetical protein
MNNKKIDFCLSVNISHRYEKNITTAVKNTEHTAHPSENEKNFFRYAGHSSSAVFSFMIFDASFIISLTLWLSEFSRKTKYALSNRELFVSRTTTTLRL